MKAVDASWQPGKRPYDGLHDEACPGLGPWPGADAPEMWRTPNALTNTATPKEFTHALA